MGSDSAYPFMKEVDWNSMLYLAKPGGSASALDWVKAIDSAIVMGTAMDSKLLKDGALAHHKAIGTIDSQGVLTKDALTEACRHWTPDCLRARVHDHGCVQLLQGSCRRGCA